MLLCHSAVLALGEAGPFKRGRLLLTCIYTYMHICVHIYITINLHTHMYTFLDIKIYGYRYIHIYVYKDTHIKPPLYFTKCAISTCKKEEEKEQRNFGHPRGLVVVGWNADHLPPSLLFTLESNS